METTDLKILIIDDEKNIRTGLAQGLRSVAASVVTAADAHAGLALFAKDRHHIVITDLRLPGEWGGMEVVKQVSDENPDTRVIVITAYASVETAVEAMRLGAFDFATKPVDLDVIRHQVRRAAEHRRLVAENRRLRENIAAAGQIPEIIGNCSASQEMIGTIRQVAQTDATVLLVGESGTWKELTARAIHDLGERRTKPFVGVNLTTLPDQLIESELFGHEKGAFADAQKQKIGHFESAEGGTLFLDEITETNAKTQIALLRVLEEREFRRVGGGKVIPSNCRVISASNQDIEHAVDDGKFREDLFYRLNVVPIRLPALRERRDDIPLLADYFLEHFCRRHNREPKRFAPQAIRSLNSRIWPGNIRQLKNFVERLVVTVADETIKLEDLPEESKPSASQEVGPLAGAVEQAERQAILAALAQCGYHREQTAKLLEISIRSLHYKMTRYGLH
jgi:two-component system response regulator AtoC